MDYAQSAPLSQGQPNTMPELGRLKAAAERIYKVQSRIAVFIDRFHGPMPEAANGEAVIPPGESYRNDLEAVFIQIERLENVVSALTTIG